MCIPTRWPCAELSRKLGFLAFFEIVRSIALQIYLTGVNKIDIEELEFTDPVVDSEQLTITISIDNIDNGSKKNDG